VAVSEQDWLSAHLCLDALLTFSSASADVGAQALACPLIESLCRLLRRLLRHLRYCGAAATEAPAAAISLAPQLVEAACKSAPKINDQVLPDVRTPEHVTAAVGPPAKIFEHTTVEESPSAKEGLLSESMQPQTPAGSHHVQGILLAGPCDRILTDPETPVSLKTPVIHKMAHQVTPNMNGTSLEVSSSKIQMLEGPGSAGNNDCQHTSTVQGVPVHSQVLMLEDSVDSVGSASFDPQQWQENSPFLLTMKVGDEPDLQLLQVLLCMFCP
jgi:hypothetical protein